MTTATTNRLAAVLLMSATMTLTACQEGDTSASAGSNTTTPAWMLDAEPADAMSITRAKADATEGQQITLRGIIGGSKNPMSDQSPVFVLVDSELYNQCTAGDDHCPTPWDYCCADPTELNASSATVQLVSDDGSPSSVNPVAAGLAGLDEVVVVGTVAPRPNEQVLTVRATGVYRVGG